MDSSANPIEAELAQFRLREERLTKSFGNLSSNDAWLHAKLITYEQIALKYRNTQNLDERIALQLMKQERRQIEKKLYPKLLKRLFRRFIVVPLKGNINLKREQILISKNTRDLKQEMRRAGFEEHIPNIEQQIAKNEVSFSVPASCGTSLEKNAEYQLSFVKDEKGAYRYEGFSMHLYDDTIAGQSRLQFFRAELNLNAEEACNLLQGRMVQKNGSWYRMDFNDADKDGNYGIEKFGIDSYVQNFEKGLRALPITENQFSFEFEQLVKGLKAGNRIEVNFETASDDKYFIEAFPRQLVKVYDKDSNEISLDHALGRMTTKEVKQLREHRKAAFKSFYMEQIKQLSDFFSAIEHDGRIGTTHIGIYAALIQFRVLQGFVNPIQAFSYEIMEIAKISAQSTYHKSLRQLSECGYIKYEPSYKCNQASKIYFPEPLPGVNI